MTQRILDYKPEHPESQKFVRRISDFLHEARRDLESNEFCFSRRVYQYSKVVQEPGQHVNRKDSYGFGLHLLQWFNKVWSVDFNANQALIHLLSEEGPNRLLADVVNLGGVLLNKDNGTNIFTFTLIGNGVKMVVTYDTMDIGLAPGNWVREPGVQIAVEKA